jgi:hypothetical protein
MKSEIEMTAPADAEDDSEGMLLEDPDVIGIDDMDDEDPDRVSLLVEPQAARPRARAGTSAR